MPKFERDVEIDAPVEKVWEVMINPVHFPHWLPGVDAVSDVRSTPDGLSFAFTSEGKAGTGALVNMQPMRHLEIMTLVEKDKDAHIFNLKPSGGFLGLNADECKVDYTLDTLMGGGILGSFVAGGNPKDAIRVKRTTVLLRKLVESL